MVNLILLGLLDQLDQDILAQQVLRDQLARLDIWALCLQLQVGYMLLVLPHLVHRHFIVIHQYTVLVLCFMARLGMTMPSTVKLMKQ